MPPSVTAGLLWLFVIDHGIAFGAGLYESRMIVAPWIEALRCGEDAHMPDSGRKFWAFVTTMPLTLLTLASLVAAWHVPGPRGTWWLVAAVITLVERIMTFAYFIPAMLRLQRGQIAPASRVQAATLWMTLNYVRLALSLAAWIAALRALSFSIGRR